MQIIDNLIIITLIVAAFIAGLKLSDKFHMNAEQDRKDALERQFLRLRAGADSDDPVKPYSAPRVLRPVPRSVIPSGDYDGDANLISPEFMSKLKENGRAATKLSKADIAK